MTRDLQNFTGKNGGLWSVLVHSQHFIEKCDAISRLRIGDIHEIISVSRMTPVNESSRVDHVTTKHVKLFEGDSTPHVVTVGGVIHEEGVSNTVESEIVLRVGRVSIIKIDVAGR